MSFLCSIGLHALGSKQVTVDVPKYYAWCDLEVPINTDWLGCRYCWRCGRMDQFSCWHYCVETKKVIPCPQNHDGIFMHEHDGVKKLYEG